MIRETLLSAVIAGLIAALALTLVQVTWVTPIIVQAETFEHPAPAAQSETHTHEVDEWRPQDGWQRTAFTFGANLLVGLGYAFVLIAVYLLWREPANAVSGVIYGIGGFAAFFVAPASGMPPELPGTAAADVAVRQLWWIMIATSTGAGLLALFSRAALWARALGAALIIVPHFIPAPQPDVHASLAPPDLQSEFRMASAVSNAVFWVLLGLVSSLAFKKWMAAHVQRDH